MTAPADHLQHARPQAMFATDDDTVTQHLDRVAGNCRLQPYRAIHKGVREMLARALNAAGALDAAADDERARLVETVSCALDACGEHLAHENRWYHAPLREAMPQLVAAFDQDHAEHAHELDALRRRVRAVRDSRGDAAAVAGYALYLALSRFVADSLEHMAQEETVLTAALWARFTDAELQAIEQGLLATLSPAESSLWLDWMARGLNLTELQAMLGDAKARAPAEAYRAMLDQVRGALDTPRAARLSRALGEPAVPGLCA